MNETPRPTPAEAFSRLLEIVKTLRAPDGCPWDREQTHESLRSDLIEEAYETVEAIESGDPSKIAEELGDLLTLAALHAQIASETGAFDMRSILNATNEKLVRRHPHVFGDTDATTSDDVLANWERIKRSEPGHEERESALDGVPKAFPALLTALKLQKKAARVGFEWDGVKGASEKVREEWAELERRLNEDDPPANELEDEIGDLLFAVANVARYARVDPENALRGASDKFTRRFQRIETRLSEADSSFQEETLESLLSMWNEAKAAER